MRVSPSGWERLAAALLAAPGQFRPLDLTGRARPASIRQNYPIVAMLTERPVFTVRHHIQSWLALALVTVVSISSARADAANSTTCGGWRFSQGAPLGRAGPSSRLLDIAARSARDAWAVGESGDQSLIEHWDGQAWQRVPSPNPKRDAYAWNALSGVSVVPNSRQVWAVGHSGPDDFETSGDPVAVRWDGRVWREVPIQGRGWLNAVSARATDDVWAVGGRDEAPDGAEEALFSTVIWHWDGHQWEKVPSPSPANGAQLEDVTATSATDAWAVGHVGYGRAFVQHWDGHQWQLMDLPPETADGWLKGVTARGPNDVIAVGKVGGTVPLMLHWDGHSWRMGRTPSAGSLDEVATNGDDVWAVGVRPGGRALRTLLLRWSGHRWQTVWTPNATSGLNGLGSVSVTGDGAVFTVGNSQRPDRGDFLPLILQRCG
jgi:hypothetical protein